MGAFCSKWRIDQALIYTPVPRPRIYTKDHLGWASAIIPDVTFKKQDNYQYHLHSSHFSRAKKLPSTAQENLRKKSGVTVCTYMY